MADIGVKNMKKPHPDDCPDAWLKFRGLQSVSIQSRDGCSCLLIQSGVPPVQSFLFVLNGQSPIALSQWEPGKRDDFFSYVVKFLSITKAYFPMTFYHYNLKSVFRQSQCDPLCFFSGFLPLFLDT